MDLTQEQQDRLVADAAHAYCAAWDERPPLIHELDLHGALLAAHRATTTSATPPTHVIVAVDELEQLKAIKRAAYQLAEVCPAWFRPAIYRLRVALGTDA